MLCFHFGFQVQILLVVISFVHLTLSWPVLIILSVFGVNETVEKRDAKHNLTIHHPLPASALEAGECPVFVQLVSDIT